VLLEISLSNDFMNKPTGKNNNKNLILCKTKNEFINVQNTILLQKNANNFMPILWKNSDSIDFEDYLIKLGLCFKEKGTENLIISKQFQEKTKVPPEGRKKIGSGDISILIRQWDAFKMTSHCIEDLFKTTYLNKKILLLDDASKDYSYLQLFLKFKDIHVIRSLHRLEYCNSFNILGKYATELKSKYVFIVNNDTCNFDLDIFDHLTENTKANIGIVSSCVKDFSGNISVSKNRKYLGIQFNIATEGYLLPVSVWNKVGGFNPDLVRYTEDLELVRELNKIGLDQRRVDNIFFSHLGNGSSSRQNFIPVYFSARNFIWIQKMYFPERSLIEVIKMSLSKVWPVVLRKNSLTNKRYFTRKFVYMIFGLFVGTIKNCKDRKLEFDPYSKFDNPPLRYTEWLV